MEQANKCYSDDFPISNIQIWIREFFEQNQPKRLNPEDAKIPREVFDYYNIKLLGKNKNVMDENRKIHNFFGVCDSLNSTNK